MMFENIFNIVATYFRPRPVSDLIEGEGVEEGFLKVELHTYSLLCQNKKERNMLL